MAANSGQQYVVYHFLEKMNDDKSLKDSIITTGKPKWQGNYLGSPATAMKCIKQQKGFYDILWFDLEKSALENGT